MSGTRIPLGYCPNEGYGAALDLARARGEYKTETLVRCARFLYGAAWVSKLARDLEPQVNSANVSKWRYGKLPIPEHYLDQVISMADEKRREIAARLKQRKVA